MKRNTDILLHKVLSNGRHAVEKNHTKPIVRKKKKTTNVPTPIVLRIKVDGFKTSLNC
jgi:hypothetical protein